ncbi:hypothetical protein EDD15DRAFT_2310938 [Pisolithus albus]|nr:hypothetical protein EDD15DRAFT_2310938 [Pisolithus albus]
MERTGYSWTTARNGQYVDGHEREDVVEYRQNKFLPAWYALDVVWFHDESTFYAHDRRKKRWVHRDEKPTPQPKGEGLSLMVADFVSADYGWLQSPDGKGSARVLFRAGKARDGYFSNDAVICQAETAMTILKRAGDALCARNMPRGCIDWGITVPKKDSDGKYLHDANGKLATEKIRITDGFHNGISQPFYWPDGHPNAGLFKGMAQIQIPPTAAAVAFFSPNQTSLMSNHAWKRYVVSEVFRSSSVAIHHRRRIAIWSRT